MVGKKFMIYKIPCKVKIIKDFYLDCSFELKWDTSKYNHVDGHDSIEDETKQAKTWIAKPGVHVASGGWCYNPNY